MPIRPIMCAAMLWAATMPAQAQAREAFIGGYVHEVETPLTLRTGESGADIAGGVRFDPIEALGAVGKPAPYVIASVNTAGDTSFAGAGLAWTIGKGPVYVRPAVALVVHDGPLARFDPVTGRGTGLGSRVLFEPEVGVGYRFSRRFSAEASWMHISHARLFNARQNPGIDMIGVRFNLRMR